MTDDLAFDDDMMIAINIATISVVIGHFSLDDWLCFSCGWTMMITHA